MTADQLVMASRVPEHVAEPERERGLWRIRRIDAPGELQARMLGFLEREGLWPYPSYTVLQRATMARMHVGGEVVMEDTPRELRRHLPVLLAARGRVLVSGLGLGCGVRGLLAKPEVQRIDVVEIDPDVIALAGGELVSDPRVTIYVGDALTIDWPPGTRWDYAWHDVHAPTPTALHELHIRLLARYSGRAARQGAWQLDRVLKRRMRMALLNSRRRDRQTRPARLTARD